MATDYSALPKAISHTPCIDLQTLGFVSDCTPQLRLLEGLLHRATAEAEVLMPIEQPGWLPFQLVSAYSLMTAHLPVAISLSRFTIISALPGVHRTLDCSVQLLLLPSRSQKSIQPFWVSSPILFLGRGSILFSFRPWTIKLKPGMILSCSYAT